jgi:hypothetical protein
MRLKSQEWAEDTPFTAQLNTVMFIGKNQILVSAKKKDSNG